VKTERRFVAHRSLCFKRLPRHPLCSLGAASRFSGAGLGAGAGWALAFGSLGFGLLAFGALS
jgi:hypothetical protein